MCLYMSVDVIQWLDWRMANNQTSPQQIQDFAIVNDDLFKEYSDFWRNCQMIFPYTPLIAFWLALSQGLPLPEVERHGKHYLRLTSQQVDGLCNWIKKAWRVYTHIGADVFT